MPAKIDITDRRFGRLIALEPTSERCGTFVVWKCLCNCGKIAFIAGRSLIAGSTKSCGCLNSELVIHRNRGSWKNITGQRFGRLIVLEPAPNNKQKDKNKDKNFTWKCRCDCGNVAYICKRGLRRDKTKSCGCLKTTAAFVRGTSISPMDVPIEIVKCLQARNKLKKAIKQAS